MPAPIDFPFYNGRPVALTARSWALVLLAVILGLAALKLPVPAGAWSLLPALLFALIPLLALRTVAGPKARTALFRRVSGRDLALAFGVAVLNIAVTFAIGAVARSWLGANANPAIEVLRQQDAAERTVFFAVSVPQLLGEELLTVLPLLALLSWFSRGLGLPRRRALLLAWLLSAVPFALVHLPTYGWNLLQCLLLIGSARLVLSTAYLSSANVLVSTLAHVLNDWMLLGMAIGLGVRAA